MLCIEAKLGVAVASATMAAAVGSASMSVDGGIRASMTAETAEVSMSVDGGMDASLTVSVAEAFFGYSCPIEFITSCYSLGGWDDNLVWDNNLGLKD